MTKIAIIGHTGMVGGAMYRYYFDKGVEPLCYALETPDEVLGPINNFAEVVFICTPTPTDKEGRQDLSALYDVAEKIKGKKIMVIRSTTLPGTTEMFQKKYPNHQWLHNPEFLSEATCDEDFRNADRQIIGYTNESFVVATKVADLLPPAPHVAYVPAGASELIKYAHNGWGTIQIRYANLLHDVSEVLGIDYDKHIKPAIKASKYTGPSFSRYYLDVVHKGKRGFQGTCFPKDLKAFEKMVRDLKVDGGILTEVRKWNKAMLKSQGLKND